MLQILDNYKNICYITPPNNDKLSYRKYKKYSEGFTLSDSLFHKKNDDTPYNDHYIGFVVLKYR